MSDVVSAPVTVSIGGAPVEIPPMSFGALKRAWPAIRSMQGKTNLVDQCAVSVEIVAAALARSRPDLTVAAIEDQLLGPEMLGLVGAIPAMLAQAGLIPAGDAKPGEAGAGAASSDQTA